MNFKTRISTGLLCSNSIGIFAQQNNAKLQELFDVYYKKANAIDPISATFNGVVGFDDLLPADDEVFLKNKHDFYAKYLKQLQGFSKNFLNKEDK